MSEQSGSVVGRAEALRRIGHSLRTPLNAIGAASQLLGLTELESAQRDHVATIRSASDALLSAVNDLIDIAEIEGDGLDLQHIPFRLPDAIQEGVRALRPAAADRGIELTVHGVGTLPTDVVGDPGRLRQVISRLVSNAITYTHQGSVDVGAELLDHDVDRVTVRIVVRDTGIGIPDDDVAAVFEPFRQGAGSGSVVTAGLGLTISQAVVRAMGGEIVVESQRGKGSMFEFVITFPRRPDADADGSGSDLSSAWVVVVGDRPESNSAIADILRGAGFEPSEFSSLPLASTSIALSDDSSTAPRAIVANPTERPFEFAERILHDRQLARAPLILVPPQGERGDAAECIRLGVAGYLPQPVSPVDLVEAVHAAAGERRDQSLITRHSLRERRSSLRILVVDDSPTGRALVMRALDQIGHDTEAATNGKEAVDRVAESAYDVVLMDMEMPEMDGIEATRAIRDSGTEVPIIGVSAHAFNADRRACLDAGMDEHITKPFRVETLQMTMEALAAQKQRS